MVFKQLRRIKEGLDDAGISTNAKVDFTPQTGTPEGRVPIGDGWYRTPEVIDPRDPINYPDSPWNGGNPLSGDMIGLDLEVSFHPCGFDLSMTPSLLFFTFPTAGLSYRNEGECRNEPPKPKRTPPSTETETKERDWSKYGAQDTDLVICGISSSRFSNNIEPFQYGDKVEIAVATYTDAFQLGGWNGDFEKLRKYYPSRSYKTDAESPILFSAPTTYSRSFVSNKMWVTRGGFASSNVSHAGEMTLYENIYGTATYDNFSKFKVFEAASETGDFFIFIGRFKTLKAYRPAESFKVERSSPAEVVLNNKLVTIGTTVITNSIKWNVDFFQNLTIPPYSKNPPPPDDDKKECCMECCSQSNQQQQDYSDLLRKILKKVENIENRVGCNEYPFNVPVSLISKHEGFLASLLPKPSKQINNEQQFIRWVFEAFEEVIGQWEIPIEIKDSDPTKPGDQPQGMKLVNIAEGFAELTAIGANASINTEVLINMGTRLLYELAAARQTTADTNAKAQALIEFFGFRTKDQKDKMEMTFTAGKDRLDETLKESMQEVVLTKFDDKKNSYKQDMASLLSAAGVIKAVFTKKTPGADQAGTAAAIASLIRDTAKAQKKAKSGISKHLEEDFAAWCESYERGWSDEITQDPNDASANEPWGEPYSERPKVVKIIKSRPAETEPKTK